MVVVALAMADWIQECDTLTVVTSCKVAVEKVSKVNSLVQVLP